MKRERNNNSRTWSIIGTVGLISIIAFAGCEKNFHIIERLSGQPIEPIPTLDTTGMPFNQTATVTPEATSQGFSLPFLTRRAVPTHPSEPIPYPTSLNLPLDWVISAEIDGYLDNGAGLCYSARRAVRFSFNPCVDLPKNTCSVVEEVGGDTTQYANIDSLFKAYDRIANGGEGRIVIGGEKIHMAEKCDKIYAKIPKLATPRPENLK